MGIKIVTIFSYFITKTMANILNIAIYLKCQYEWSYVKLNVATHSLQIIHFYSAVHVYRYMRTHTHTHIYMYI